jgi:hypothetical protein
VTGAQLSEGFKEAGGPWHMALTSPVHPPGQAIGGTKLLPTNNSGILTFPQLLPVVYGVGGQTWTQALALATCGGVHK